MRARLPLSIGTVVAAMSLQVMPVCAEVSNLVGDGSDSQEVRRTLTFEDRVKAQEAIERVYYSHQIGASKPFEEMVPRAVLQQKVRTYLEQSAALDRFWKTPITDEMLQRELERMSHGTRLPERLRELYDALNDDPVLIKEVLARAALADRLSRSFFAFDRSIHAKARASADELHRRVSSGELSPFADHPDRSVTEFVLRDNRAEGLNGELRALDRVGDDASHRLELSAEKFEEIRSRLAGRTEGDARMDEERDAFVVEVLLAESAQGLRVARFVVPKLTWDTWWPTVRDELRDAEVAAVGLAGALPMPRNVAGEVFPRAGRTLDAPSAGPCLPDDTWDNGSLGDLPVGRFAHTAVWTGSLMVIWGGSVDLGMNQLDTGGRYDPATDSWSLISTTGAPSARVGHTAVWTGILMMVWGGNGNGTHLNTGGRYNPVTDSWSPMSTTNAPSARSRHAAVWTGNLMVVWGGAINSGALNTGGRYSPVTNSWTPTAVTGAPLRRDLHTAVWTGSKMVVWGGRDPGFTLYNTGGQYDPALNSWAPTAVTGAPSMRSAHTAVWTGSVMVVWGGAINTGALDTGGRYNPATNSWTPTSATGAPAARYNHTAVWAGSLMVIWGGESGTSVPTDTGRRYDPVADTWTSTSTSTAPSPRAEHTAVWTGSLMLVWGGRNGTSLNDIYTGGRYDPATDSWTPTSTSGAPSPRPNHTAVWTGSLMVVWGGIGASTGGRYDPATDTWTPTSTTGAPSPRDWHTAVWTGNLMVVWGGRGGQIYFDTGGRYDPATDTWTPTSTTGAPSPRLAHTAVWTGSLMVVWGGDNDASSQLDSGGRYDPATDVWAPMSTTGAPSARFSHTAVWTGNLMVVWGGIGSNGTALFATGGKYDPLTDTWTPTSTTNAPSGRYEHTAVWTGSVMVVWGGSDPNASNTGGQYNPATDSWSPTSTTGAPSARRNHSAVWTGNLMVVWGATADRTGGRYDPAMDIWTSTSTVGAPAARSSHTAVWTGSLMIIWGGFNLNSGGRYAVGEAPDLDGDGYSECEGDCNDSNPSIFPAAAQLCDGINNDCSDASWPAMPANETDSDADGFRICQGDCDDTRATDHPGAAEICNGRDDNCEGQIDEDAFGVDADDDGVRNACDNCVFDGNPAQSDVDHDAEGDRCDLDDGLIYVTNGESDDYREWQSESGYSTWNSYRGSLGALRATGVYTQAPGSNSGAARDCGLTEPWVFDDFVPPVGDPVFHLTTGVAGGVESSLGMNSAGSARPNANPCP